VEQRGNVYPVTDVSGCDILVNQQTAKGHKSCVPVVRVLHGSMLSSLQFLQTCASTAPDTSVLAHHPFRKLHHAAQHLAIKLAKQVLCPPPDCVDAS
jgi:hypothetical protein